MKLAVLLLSLLLVSPSWAADGDPLASYSSGAYNVTEYLLCDGAINDCDEFDLSGGGHKLPLFLVVSILNNNCTGTATAMEIQLNSRTGITTAAATTPGAHAAGILRWDLVAGGVGSITVNPTTHRYIRGEVLVTGAGGTCNSFQAVLRAFYPRSN